MSKSIKLSIIN